MSQSPTTPSVSELISELATIEDRIRSAEALVHGGLEPPLNPELMRLARRERQLLDLLRRQRSTA